MNELRVYNIVLGESDMGVYATSLVEMPAIESDGMYMSAEEENSWLLASEEKGEFIGAVLVPDKLILRRNKSGEEFYVKFSKEVIADIHQRMQQTVSTHNFTIDHSLSANGAVEYMESWIKETEEDKSVGFGINEPVGTLFMKVKLTSKFLRDAVKDGKLKGFSVELDASLTRAEFNKQTKQEMDFSDILKNVLETDNGFIHYSHLDEGDSVMLKSVKTENDEEVVSWEKYDGVFVIDSFMFSVKDGVITEKVEVKEAEITETKEEDEKKEVVVDFSKVDESIANLSQTLLASIEALQGKVEEMESKVNGIDEVASSIEEFKLEFKQDLAKKETEKEEIELSAVEDFDVDAYKKASSWGR